MGVKVLLVGGTSHVGKSTLARRLARELGWNHLSTDQLARHPGRPWASDRMDLPDDVIAHYSTLSTPQLVDAVLQHYRQNVWPIVVAVVQSHLNNPYEPCLVFEGSAILPELVVAARFERTNRIWLTSTDDTTTGRILGSSQFDQRSDGEKQLIQAFLERTLAFNRKLLESVSQLGEPSIDVSSPDIYDRLVAACEWPLSH